MSFAGAGGGIVVAAFGGNALLPAGARGLLAERRRLAARAARPLADLLARGLRLCLVHGNGPQVGNELIRIEEAVTKVPPDTLDLAVASTQGSMGFLIMEALYNQMARQGIMRPVATLVTTVRVDPEDPAFTRPSKPVGPFFNAYRADRLKRLRGWEMAEDAGRGWRKLVPSPRPLEVIEAPVAADLLDRGHVVIAGGGGGVPVWEDERHHVRGVEAVIDKDRTAALLARAVGARTLLSLTGVDAVCLDYESAHPRPQRHMTATEARAHLAAGQFPAGSMGPKVESAVEFVEAGGERAVITSAGRLRAAWRGRAGTTIVPG